jgi:hypothetical protein
VSWKSTQPRAAAFQLTSSDPRNNLFALFCELSPLCFPIFKIFEISVYLRRSAA